MQFGNEPESEVEGPPVQPLEPRDERTIRQLEQLLGKESSGPPRTVVGTFLFIFLVIVFVGSYALWKDRAAVKVQTVRVQPAPVPAPVVVPPPATPLDITLQQKGNEQLLNAQRNHDDIAGMQKEIDALLGQIKEKDEANVQQQAVNDETFGMLAAKRQELRQTLARFQEALDARIAAEKVGKQSIEISEQVLEKLKSPALLNTVVPAPSPQPRTKQVSAPTPKQHSAVAPTVVPPIVEVREKSRPVRTTVAMVIPDDKAWLFTNPHR